MGEHSVLLLDEERAPGRAQAGDVRVPRRGDRAAGDRSSKQLAAENVASWPVGRPFAVHPHMNDISLEVILRIVFGVTDEARREEMRPLLQQLIRIGPTIFLGWMYPGLQRVGPWRRFARLKDHVDELRLRRDRRAAHRRQPRRAHRRAVQAARRRPDAERRGAARSPDHAAARRARDDRLDAGLDVPRPRPPPAAAGPRAARRRRERRGLPRGGRQGGDAAASGDPQRGPPAQQAGVGRRLRPAGRRGACSRRSSSSTTARTSSTTPTEFRPERFLGSNPPPATWIPFGGGLRRCLGASLAMVEAVAVLKAVLRQVEIAPGGPAERSKMRNITTVPGARRAAGHVPALTGAGPASSGSAVTGRCARNSQASTAAASTQRRPGDQVARRAARTRAARAKQAAADSAEHPRPGAARWRSARGRAAPQSRYQGCRSGASSASASSA